MQLDGLPALRRTVHLPTIGRVTQRPVGLRRTQQQMAWQHPSGMGDTEANSEQARPEWNLYQRQAKQRQPLNQGIASQQLP